jgi:hypothetical protein
MMMMIMMMMMMMMKRNLPSHVPKSNIRPCAQRSEIKHEIKEEQAPAHGCARAFFFFAFEDPCV